MSTEAAVSTRATGRFEIKKWDEKPYEELEGGKKLTRASVQHSWHGDIEGEGTLEYLMAYRDDGSADYAGQHRVVGSIGGRSGSFVLQDRGTFSGEAARGTLSVVPGLATGGLKGLHGEGSYVSKKGEHHSTLTLDYDFE